MSRTTDWEKACDRVMPSVCQPARASPPLKKPKSKPAPVTHIPAYPGYPSNSVERKPEPDKISIALRIGVFFDGTGNNAANTARGMACGAQHPIKPHDLDASCKPYMSDPDSSYGNDVSNVKKLSDLYVEGLKGGSSGKLALRKVYIDGIGTTAGQKDNSLGLGTARGNTGINGRVLQAFKFIDEVIEEIIQSNPDGEIRVLTFDTFGFSRGAAAARHFANEVARGNQGPLRSSLRRHEKGFSRIFLDVYRSDINMGFIGLFDTVAAVAGFTNLGDIQSPVAPGVSLHLPRSLFSDVVHLVARDEHRANFPLSRVKPDHLEITLPGVHSDIGGGYLVEAQERVLVDPMRGLTVPKGTDVTTTSIYRDAQQHKARMIAQGWPDSLLEIVTPEPRLLPPNPQDHMGIREQRIYAGLQLERPVRGELSRVYLRVMYELAKQKGVRFDDIPETPDYQLPEELQPLCNRFIAGDYSVTPAEEALLKLRYIHMSAHWNHPLDKTGQGEARLLYINAPTPDTVRVQHPHVAGWDQ